MKLVSWNVNSINARLDRFLPFLQEQQPDVICLQETKCQDEKFPSTILKELGYEYQYLHGQKSYNGVAILGKKRLDLVSSLLPGINLDQARFIHVRSESYHIINLYAPNGQHITAPAFQYKMEWFEQLIRYLINHQKHGLPTIIAGDFNIARDALDVYDPDLFEGSLLFTKQERQIFSRLLDMGYQDIFRVLQPSVQMFSWWDYRQLSFPKNKGARIDYILCDTNVLSQCLQCTIDRNWRKGKKPSDHAPLILVTSE